MEIGIEGDNSAFPGVAKAFSIHLSLDDYEDIFSDFDPRPYSERMLSEDFLHELKRASLDREERGMVLTLLVPKERRNAAHERVILERLRGHFRRHFRRLEEKRRSQKKNGGWMAVVGILFMVLAAYLLFQYRQTLWSALVVVFLEPAGWFTFWEGLSLVFFRSRETTPDLEFYRKMAGAKIAFSSDTGSGTLPLHEARP